MRTRLIPLNTLILLLLFSSPAAGQAESPTLITQIGRGSIQSVEWYPGGEYVLVSTTTGAWIYTYFLQEVAYLPDAHMASLSADGRHIAAVNSQNHLMFWDVEALQDITSLPHESDYFSHIYDLAWSPDGPYFSISGIDQWGNERLSVWSVSEDSDDYVGIHGAPPYTNLLWSPSGTYLAAYTPGHSGILLYPSSNSGSLWGSFTTEEDTVVKWKDDHTLRTYDVREGDTSYIVNEWNAITGEHETTFNSPNSFSSYTPDGRYSAFSGWDRVIVRDALSPQSEYESPSFVESGNLSQVSLLTWSEDQRYLAAGSSSPELADAADIAVIDIQEAQILHHWTDALQGISLFAWSPHSRWLLVVDEHQQIMVYEVQSGEQIAYSAEHTAVGTAFSWSPDGTQMAIGDNLDNVTIRDSANYMPLYTLSDHPSTVTRIAWQPTGERIALEAALRSWNPDHHTEIWDVSGEVPQNVSASFQTLHDEPINFARFSANGERLAIITGGQLLIWDFTGELPKLVVRDSFGTPREVWFSPSGTAVIYRTDFNGHQPPYRTPKQEQYIGFMLSYGGNVQFAWDSNGTSVSGAFLSPHGTYRGTLGSSGNSMIQTSISREPIAWVNDAANMVWSPDETRLVVQRTDGSLWILESDGTILAQIPTPPDMQAAVGDFYWSPDSRQLAHLHDGVIDVWQVSG